jgi:Protein of unknown function (DUF3828)
MRLCFITLISLSMTAATAPATPVDRLAVQKLVKSIMAPYAKTNASPPNSFDMPRYTRATRALINRWSKSLKPGYVTDMADGDWICQCQDWDPKAFRITSISIQPMKNGEMIADTRYFISPTDARRLKFVLAREGGNWLVSDLIFEDSKDSMTVQLAREMGK